MFHEPSTLTNRARLVSGHLGSFADAVGSGDGLVTAPGSAEVSRSREASGQLPVALAQHCCHSVSRRLRAERGADTASEALDHDPPAHPGRVPIRSGALPSWTSHRSICLMSTNRALARSDLTVPSGTLTRHPPGLQRSPKWSVSAVGCSSSRRMQRSTASISAGRNRVAGTSLRTEPTRSAHLVRQGERIDGAAHWPTTRHPVGRGQLPGRAVCRRLALFECEPKKVATCPAGGGSTASSY